MKTREATAISHRVLWLGIDENAMQARVTLYHYAEEKYEVYTQVGGEVPKRHIGKLGECLDRGQRFVDSLLAQGWVMDLPCYYPAFPQDTVSIG